MDVSDVFQRVKSQFGDFSSAQLKDADIINWINDGQREIVMQIEGVLEAVAYLDSVTGQIRYVLPTDLSTIRQISALDHQEGSYYDLKWKSLGEMTKWADGWDGTFYGNAFPVAFTREEGKLIVFPAFQEDITDAVKIVYSRYPVDVVDVDSAIDLPLYLHNTLVNYVMTQAYEMDEDWESAQIKGGQFQNDVNFNASREDWVGQGSYPTIMGDDDYGDYYYG